MTQSMLDTLDVVTPILNNGISSEYSITCGPELSISIRKGTEYTVTLQKGRVKIVLTMDEWRDIAGNYETLELGFLLLSGTLGRVHK